MKIIKYSSGIITVKDFNEVKEWRFYPPRKPRIKNQELVELKINFREIALTGCAYFIKAENAFYGTGALEQIS